MVSDMELGVKLNPKTDNLENMDAQEMPVDMQPDDEGGVMGGGGAGMAAGGAGMGGGQRGGGMMGKLGGIMSKLTMIAGVIGVLLMLEPIMQVLNMIIRFLEVMILPFVAILMTLLQPLMQKLLKAMPEIMAVAEKIGNFYKQMYSTLFNIAKEMAATLVDALPSWLTGGGDGGKSEPKTKRQTAASAGAFGLASMNPATLPFSAAASSAAGNVDWKAVERELLDDDKQILPEQVFSDKTDESKKESMTSTTSTEADKTYGG